MDRYYSYFIKKTPGTVKKKIKKEFYMLAVDIY